MGCRVAAQPLVRVFISSPRFPNPPPPPPPRCSVLCTPARSPPAASVTCLQRPSVSVSDLHSAVDRIQIRNKLQSSRRCVREVALCVTFRPKWFSDARSVALCWVS
jgi:hypothetical protein